MTATSPQSTRTRPAAARWVVFLCWATVAVEGFDLVVLGAVMPSLLGDWHLSANEGAIISTVGLVGVAIGAVSVGTLTDKLGRRKALLFSVGSFSVLTLLCAVAPNPEIFGLLRLLAGFGLGGCLPTAAAMVTEYAKPNRGGGAMTLMMTGYHTGAVVTSLLAIPIIPAIGWHWLFVVGAVIGFVIFAVMWVKLPESVSFLAAKRRMTEARDIARRLDVPMPKEADAASPPVRLSALFKGRFLRATVIFWIASFMGLLLVYGLNTWMPVIMRAGGYPLGASLSLLLTLNAGGVLGMFVAGRVSDTWGNKPANLLWFALAAVLLALLAIKMPFALLYVAVGVSGMFVFSAQVLVYAYIGRFFPPEVRASAIGLSSGVGRLGAITGPIIGGALVTAGIAYPWGFFVFAGVAVIGMLALIFVPRIRE